MKQTKYKRPSLRALVHTFETLEKIEEFAVRLNEGIRTGQVTMSEGAVRKLNLALRARREYLSRPTVLYGPDGRAVVKGDV